MSSSLGQSGFRYVTIIHGPRPGYRVNIPDPRRSGAVVSKVFGGYRHCVDVYLRQAVTSRDRVYLSLHGLPVPEEGSRLIKGAGVTGIPGVRRVVKKVSRVLKSGERRTYDIACIVAEAYSRAPSGEGDQRSLRSKVFSIAKHGEAEALRLATIWRTHAGAMDCQPWREAMEREAVYVPPFSSTEPGQALESRKVMLPLVPPPLSDPTASEPFYLEVAPVFALVRDLLSLNTDRALANALHMTFAEISKMRRGTRPVGATILLRLHEVTRMPTARLRMMMGDRRRLFRP